MIYHSYQIIITTNSKIQYKSFKSIKCANVFYVNVGGAVGVIQLVSEWVANFVALPFGVVNMIKFKHSIKTVALVVKNLVLEVNAFVLEVSAAHQNGLLNFL